MKKKKGQEFNVCVYVRWNDTVDAGEWLKSRKPFWNRAMAMIENINKKKKTSRIAIGKQITDTLWFVLKKKKKNNVTSTSLFGVF